ncbi:sodium- and chloride-dependent neutral and basic amino acid transporter B(0+)-like [Homarus americanus]|uniref:sodium- and chloride-dependent neutral and basic amino acid transporter B(0+)-like n=1 Tax=Homarus americanus TaxID=6706 RepID=UPI001C4544DD|nr:sodium- and chloride-dependent neutral and basic amino acid transporter B(0+)-like [Homarus americanus]
MIKAILRRLHEVLARPSPERGTFTKPGEAFLALAGYSVGLGNFWRFPYYSYKYGGAAFLISYIVCMMCIGLPLYFMELALGQYVSLGPTQMFSFMCPLLSGVGWGMVLLLLLVTIYYNLLLSWALFYIGASFFSPLPWSDCQNDFNTDDYLHSNPEEKSYVAAKEYFIHDVLGQPTGEEGTYEFHGLLVLCLALAWVLVALCLGGGIRGTGKILYVTVIFPYVVLACLLAINYDRSNDAGRERWLASFSNFNSSELLHLDIWISAASQVIYSLGVAYGGITTLSSYNSLQQNFIRDAVLVCLLDVGTSLLSGFVLFSSTVVLTDKKLEDSHGTSVLVFTALSAMLSRINSRPWSILFFFMVLTLGLDSQFVMVEAVTTAVFDQFQVLRRNHLPVVMGTCSLLFVLGLPMCTNYGLSVFNLMDMNTSKHSLLMLGFLEVFIVSYIYGFEKMVTNVKKDLRLCVPRPLYWYWAATWTVITPLCLLALTVLGLWSEDWSVGDSLSMFVWGQVIAFGPVFLVPIFGIYKIWTRGDQSLGQLLSATANFCPQYLRNGRDPVTNNQYLPENHFCGDNRAFDLQEL